MEGYRPFFHQHDVDIINDHTISIFDNNSKVFHGGRVVDGNNRVIIYNFKNNQYSTYLSDSLIKNDVRTPNQGRSEILPNKDLLIEESFYARLLYFNANGSLRWSHVNKASNGEIYKVGWSRIMHTKEDIEIVKNFIKTKEVCNE